MANDDLEKSYKVKLWSNIDNNEIVEVS